jgi:hypothetical protein
VWLLRRAKDTELDEDAAAALRWYTTRHIFRTPL